MNKFKYIFRDRKREIVLIPGWATDHRIFDKLDIDYDYIVPTELDPETFNEDLLKYAVENNKHKFSLFGWSMGGNIAAKFADENPLFVEKIMLASVKEKYDRTSIENIKKLIHEGKKAYLYKFYADCFAPAEKEQYLAFKSSLQKEYLEKDEDYLIKGLDYLVDNPIDIKRLLDKDVEFIYGGNDRIVQVTDVLKMKNSLPKAKFTLHQTKGHMPFDI